MVWQPSAARAWQLLHDAGFRAYAVGGCVRDALMGRPCHDWDIASSARPGETMRVFSEFRCIPTGLAHGTVTVLIDGVPLEITTFRVDSGYSDGRHPDSVRFADRIEDDLARRDFTMNAIAAVPGCARDGTVDPFGGEADIRAHLIRCVGEPRRRFAEDALRILRALRFASELGFSIDPETSEALSECRALLDRLSAERVMQELSRLLCGAYAADVLSSYKDVLRVVCPVSDTAEDRLRLLPPRPELRLAALLWDCPEAEALQVLRTLRFDRHTQETVPRLLAAVRRPLPSELCGLRRCMGEYGALWDDVLTLAASSGTDTRALMLETELVRQRGDALTVGMLRVSGRDLVSLGLRGPAVGRTLEALLDAVQRGALPNTKPALMEAASRLAAR